MKGTIMRQGIAMIELIFAIVIMGIVLMSAPMLISTATQSSYATIQQEGINEAASQVNMILGYAWDESNTVESRTTVILQTTNGDGDLNETIAIGRRAGTPMSSYRTFLDSNGLKWSASTIGADGDMDDMDDFDGSTALIEIQATSIDYIEKETNILISRDIKYIDDESDYLSPGADKKIMFSPDFSTAFTGTSNIKKISVILTSESGVDELEKSITLHAFSCNIGTYNLEER